MRKLLICLAAVLGVVGTAWGAHRGDSLAQKEEVRAAWLATVKGIDWPRHQKDSLGNPIIDLQADQEALVQMITAIKDVGCNTVYFQVVSNMDALYPSDILPWSYLPTNIPGEDPGYDPLQLAIETCRNLGLKIHAWLNPLRCGALDLPRGDSHPVNVHPEWIRTYKDMYYLDPAMPEVQEHLASVVRELLLKYDLDGIHIDDYFYPAGFQSDPLDWDDARQYEAYIASGGTEDRELWRFRNINACVKAMHDATHETSDKAVFGISPGGRLVNTVALYADPRFWVEEGTIDYLIPQIYWQHGHPIADFAQVMASWEEIMKGVPMYVGLAAYRYGQKGFESVDEFRQQIDECREAPWVHGHAWFSAKCILTDEFKAFLMEGPYKD